MKWKYLIALIASVTLASCGITQTTASYYEQKPQILRTERDGTYVIRSTGRGRTAVEAMEEARKNAVYEIVFNGIISTSATITSIKPVVKEVNAREKHADYFNAFFADGGKYKDFISTKARRTGSSDFTRNSSLVQCRTDISVDVAALRLQLQKDNIIK